MPLSQQKSRPCGGKIDALLAISSTFLALYTLYFCCDKKNFGGFVFAKDVFKKDVFKKEFVESFGNYRVSPDTVTLIDEIDADYKRRQGNLVLRAVKNIKPEIYERKGRHRVNDNNLKRRLSISHRKVGKLIGGFLSSVGQDSEYLTRDFSDRLQEIEKQMQAEREEAEARAANPKHDWGK